MKNQDMQFIKLLRIQVKQQLLQIKIHKDKVNNQMNHIRNILEEARTGR